MPYILIILILTIFSCEKEGIPVSKKYTLNGIYIFKKVSISIVDNSTKTSNAFYQNGEVFINPSEVDGLDTIVTDFSLLKISKNKIYFNAEIKNLDTLWRSIYECSHSEVFTYSSGTLIFYPFGSVRNCMVESANGKDFVINPPIIWPYSNNGPAYNLIYIIQKVKS